MDNFKDQKVNWKYIAIVAVFAVIAGGVILAYINGVNKEINSFSSISKIKIPKKTITDETADWEIYRNEKYGFEVKYPKDWSISDDDIQIIFFPPGGKPQSTDWNRGIVIGAIPIDIIIGDWKDIFRNLNNETEKKIKVGLKNYNALEIKYKDGKEYVREIFIEYGGILFSFSIPESSPYVPEFNKMLSTFQFSDDNIYKNEKYGYEITYLKGFIKIFEENGKAVLVHSIPFEHPNPCNFKGDLPLLKTLTDFKISLEIVHKNLAETIRAKNDDYFVSNFLVGNKLKITPGFIDEITIDSLFNPLKGYRITSGAEGCGQYTYYFPLAGNNTLIVIRSFIPEFNPINKDYKKYLKLSRVISPDTEKALFNGMLSTFRFSKEEKPYIKVLSPNGGEKWIKGSTYNIKWKSEEVDKIDIILIGFTGYGYESVSVGSSPIEVIRINDISALSGIYSLTILKDNTSITSGSVYKIRIIGKKEGVKDLYDFSDNYFSIIE